MICTKPQLVAYLEKKNLFNFNKMVLGYVKTAIDSPAVYVFFKTIIADWEFFTDLETMQNDNFWCRSDKIGDV